MRDFRSLLVWARAHQLTLIVYTVTRDFPEAERYGLTRQIRRACALIPARLAEGCGRGTEGDLLQACSAAMGAASELEYDLFLARDIGLMNDLDYERLAPT
jgi:four helix bundle protein